MQFPNLSGPGVTLSQQQLGQLINLLSKQPAANPSSPSFDPNYFSQVLNLGQGVQASPSNQPSPVMDNTLISRYNLVRVVDDPSTIEAKEVVMGVANLFPSSDGERIFVKTWDNDGRITPRVYVLQTDDGATDVSEEESRFNDVEKRLSDLEAAVAKLKKQQSQKPSKPKTKPKVLPKNVETVVEENNSDVES